MNRFLLKSIAMLLLCLLVATAAAAQEGPARYEMQAEGVPLREALQAFTKKTEVGLLYEPELAQGKTARCEIREARAGELLGCLLEGTGLTYRRLRSGTFVLEKPSAGDETSSTVSGYVENAASGERLAGANVYDVLSGRGAATNRYGFFSLETEGDSARLSVSYVGFQDTTLALRLRADRRVTIQLSPKATLLGEVEIAASRIPTAGISQVQMTPDRIKELPAVLGEPDILKALQLLPGASGGIEGSSGLYVRGGDPSQNLILLDGAPVYNASHLFGFFSTFNTDAVQNVKLVKGGFPARYGGRLSSVVDVTMKEGNRREFAGEGGVGLVASRLTVEGPIQEGKSSFMVSGRRTFIDLLTRPFYYFVMPDVSLGYYFWDLSAKVNHDFSDRSRAFLSIYGGRDRFYSETKESGEGQDAGLGWGNWTASARWTYQPSSTLFLTTNLLYSRYRFGIDIEEQVLQQGEMERSAVRYYSSVRDWSARASLDYVLGFSHHLKTGLEATRHHYRPGALQQEQDLAGEAPFDTTYTDPTPSIEAVAYVEDQMHLTNRLSANLGLRGSAFWVEGRRYGALQPRFSAAYQLFNQWRLRGAFTKMQQYVHLLTNSGVGLPTDLWVPSTPRVGPEDAWQAGLGVSRSFGAGRYEVSLDGYYKEMQGVIAYKEGASFLKTGEGWGEKVAQGRGVAYGLELFAQKKEGPLTGWLGYTLARSTRQFGALNSDEPFPFRYDRRHDLELTASYKISERRSISASWVYRTGPAVTMPIARYNAGDVDVYNYYGGRNNVRMRPYHRLDVAYHITYPTSWGRGELTLSAYNAYNRINPFYMRLNSDKEYVEVGLVPIVPSVSYRFSF